MSGITNTHIELREESMKSLEAQRLEGSSKKKMSVRAGIAFLLMVVFFIVATVLPAAAGRCDPGKDDNKPGCGPSTPGAPSAPQKIDIFEVHWNDTGGFVVVGEHFLQDLTTLTATLGDDDEDGGIILIVDNVSDTMIDLSVNPNDLPLEHGTYILKIRVKNTVGSRKADGDIAITLGNEIKHVTFGGGIVDANSKPPNTQKVADGDTLELSGACAAGSKVIGISCPVVTGLKLDIDGNVVTTGVPPNQVPVELTLDLDSAGLDHVSQGGTCTWKNNNDNMDAQVSSREGWLLCVDSSLVITPAP